MTDPVVLPKIRRKVLGDQLADRLAAMPGPTPVTVYRGEVSAQGRWPQVPGSVDPPVAVSTGSVPDPSGRVAPYVVVFDGTGPVNLEADLALANEDLRWSPQITVAAGWSPDCAQLVDQVCAWVYRWTPVVSGCLPGGLVPVPGYDAGPPRPDRTVEPPRFFVPMFWRLDIAT